MIYNNMRRNELLLLAKQKGFRFPTQPSARALVVMFENLDTAYGIIEKYDKFKVKKPTAKKDKK